MANMQQFSMMPVSLHEKTPKPDGLDGVPVIQFELTRSQLHENFLVRNAP